MQKNQSWLSPWGCSCFQGKPVGMNCELVNGETKAMLSTLGIESRVLARTHIDRQKPISLLDLHNVARQRLVQRLALVKVHEEGWQWYSLCWKKPFVFFHHLSCESGFHQQAIQYHWLRLARVKLQTIFVTELLSTSSQKSQLQSAEMSCLRAPAYCLMTQPSNSTSQSIYPPEPPCPQGPCCSLTVGYIPCIQEKAQVSGKNRSPSKTSGWRYL